MKARIRCLVFSSHDILPTPPLACGGCLLPMYCPVLCCADLHCIALSYYTHSGSKRVTSVQSRVLEAEAEAEEEEEGRAG